MPDAEISDLTVAECDAFIGDYWEQWQRTRNPSIYSLINDWLDYRYVLQMTSEKVAA